MDTIYELRETTIEETYHQMGFFKTLAAAIQKAEETHNCNPLSNDPDEYVKLTIVEQRLDVVSTHGKIVYECEWIEKWDEDSDEARWEGPTVLNHAIDGRVRFS